MESTIYLSCYFFLTIFFIPSISYFEVKCLEKIVVGKVIVAKAIGIFSLYIGKIRFVINILGKGQKNN